MCRWREREGVCGGCTNKKESCNARVSLNTNNMWHVKHVLAPMLACAMCCQAASLDLASSYRWT